LTAPLSIARNSTSASAARPISRVEDAPSVWAWRRTREIAEITIAETECAQREHLEKPVEHDGDTAEQHRGLAARCAENEGIVQHDERDRQNRRHPHDVQRIRQRNETPFRRRQVEDETDHDAEDDEQRQNAQQ
jgi:hypothetical protein